MFSLHTTPGKKPPITGHFGFALETNFGQGNHMVIVASSFSKSPVLKCFLSAQKRKTAVFKFLRFEERFRKAPFSWRISVDGRPNCRNKAVFSNFSGEVWTDLNWTKGLMSRTMAVHVRYNSLYISLPFSAKQQRELTKFCVVRRTWTTTANFFNFCFKFIDVFQI